MRSDGRFLCRPLLLYYQDKELRRLRRLRGRCAPLLFASAALRLRVAPLLAYARLTRAGASGRRVPRPLRCAPGCAPHGPLSPPCCGGGLPFRQALSNSAACGGCAVASLPCGRVSPLRRRPEVHPLDSRSSPERQRGQVLRCAALLPPCGGIMGRLQAEGLTASRARHMLARCARSAIRAGLRPETLDTFSTRRNSQPESRGSGANGAHTSTERTRRRRSAGT